ncbi:MAG: YeeE/YedE thiosulfate transporter family protein [Bacteroidota bacterium]
MEATFFEWITQPWPWWLGGIMITVIMGSMLFMNKTFGVSSTFRAVCAATGGGKYSNFFQFDWKNQMWNMVFILGALIGGIISETLLASPDEMALSSATVEDLTQLGVQVDTQYMAPISLFSWQSLLSFEGFFLIIVGGFLVGFGARYAGGCTSGHAISGLSNLQVPSLVAVIGFFIGGLIMTHFIYPLVLG